ncbi:MAG: tetratricopeptide repeat protein [Waterburya sp.]
MNVKEVIKPTEANKSIPYVISPRHTFLDTRKPTIRWNKVLGASSYTVKIVRDSEVVWTKKVEGKEFMSLDKFFLQAEIAYSVIVESDNGQSSEMDSNQSELEFKVLDEQEICNVSNQINQVKEQRLNDEDETLRLVDIYREHGLNAKAIKILEQKTNNSIQSAEIYLELGNFYQVAGLYLSAQKQYRKSLTLIKGKQELEISIAATAELIDTLTLLGNQDEAKELKTKLESLEVENPNSPPDNSIISISSGCCEKNGKQGQLYKNPQGTVCLTNSGC